MRDEILKVLGEYVDTFETQGRKIKFVSSLHFDEIANDITAEIELKHPPVQYNMTLEEARNKIAFKHYREKWSTLSINEKLKYYDEVAELYASSKVVGK